MTERQEICAITAAGALVGAVTSFLFLTDRGRRMRRQIVPALDELAREASRVRDTIEQTLTAASDSWGIVNDVINESGSAELRASRNRTRH